jgi:ankyrin repeat protein
MNDNYRITTLLLQSECNTEQVDKIGQTPLLVALQYRAYKSLKILIEHGCNVNIQEYRAFNIVLMEIPFYIM